MADSPLAALPIPGRSAVAASRMRAAARLPLWQLAAVGLGPLLVQLLIALVVEIARRFG